MSNLESISPIDGRYVKNTQELKEFFSEYALIKYRIIVEGEYLIALKNLNKKEQEIIRAMYDVGEEVAERVKEFEATTNHDVKAVEYFLKEKLSQTSLKDYLEWIHFALTSEDTNNIAYGLILSESLKEVIIPNILSIIKIIKDFATQYADLPMLARTHGQSASPTTLGKEFKVFEVRLARQIVALKKYKVSVKLNGATGNYNAHKVAYPNRDWLKFSRDFIDDLSLFRKIKLETNLHTTQIEPHDTYAELFDNMRRINVILIDFNQDIWRYISDRWIVQKPKEGEVGSSTMPHKINPIDFENSEGNLGLANALFGYFSLKLPISRLQRDLSDSTVERNFGTAFAHSLVAYKSLVKGLGKITADREKIVEELDHHQEIIAEAIQTILRREGLTLPYESLKKLTRGRKVSRKDFERFIQKLFTSKKITRKVKDELLHITPRNYIGLAEKLIS